MKTQLANEFSRQIRRRLTAKQMMQVLERNITADAECCHTHDFIDANVVMCSAWRKVMKRKMNLQSDADCALWGAAWMLAKKHNFCEVKGKK